MAELLASPIPQSRFALGSALGSGACGQVWEAWDRQTSERLVLKVARQGDELAGLRLRCEHRALKRLRSPGLAQALDLFVPEGSGGLSYLTRTLVPGRSFSSSSLVRFPDLESPEGLAHMGRLLLPLVSALEALHKEGLVHQDLRPENLIFDPLHGCSLLDLDQAVPFGTPPSGGVPEGPWVAPERRFGLPAAPSADWYAFGALLYTWITGEWPKTSPPFRGGRSTAVPSTRHHRPGVPEALDSAVLQLLDPRPAVRPAAAGMRSVFASLGMRSLQPVRESEADLRLLEELRHHEVLGLQLLQLPHRASSLRGLLRRSLAFRRAPLLEVTVDPYEVGPSPLIDPLADSLARWALDGGIQARGRLAWALGSAAGDLRAGFPAFRALIPGPLGSETLSLRALAQALRGLPTGAVVLVEGELVGQEFARFLQLLEGIGVQGPLWVRTP